MDFPESTDAVRIMTIHKSKGLAFKVVIIPFTDWRIEPGSKGPLLWVESPFSDFKTIRAVPVKYSSYLEQTNFSQAYYEEKLQSYMDALNMLYVACTRAKDELYIYSSRYKETPGGPSNIGHFLYKAVSEPYSTGDRLNDLYIEPSDLFKLETQEFLFDDAHAGPIGSSSEHKQEIIDADLNLNDMEEAGIDIFNQLKIKYKSSDFMIEFDQEIESKVNYGILMHTIFSRIRTTEDIDKVIQEMHFEGLLTYTECSVIQDKIKAILSRPNVQGWFSEGYEIHNEEALLTMSGNIKIPDRVLINEEKVIVIDFKFGKHYEKYSAQIKEYARLLEEVYNKPSEAYIYYVEDDRVERF
jgi:ATP-dependent exoDNAse (exonuclease V) beta subunit